ncbi:MAG: hypothetical protein AAGC81_00755 [Pseudomonadota bacterium]
MGFQGEADEAQGALATAVAIAAVSVDGRCKERSPADMALFGPGRDRLIERFSDVSAGQDLLVRATADGSAASTALLETVAGPMPFRISLWRQRGGDRIRLIAAFAQVTPGTKSDAAPKQDLGRLDLPLKALVTLAERVRAGAPDEIDHETSDLLSAAWRLKSILDDLDGGDRSGLAEMALSEIDIGRLSRRVTRMAEAGLRSRRISAEYIQTEGRLLNVVGDEQALWDMLDQVVASLVEGMGDGGSLTFRFESLKRGCTLTVTAERALKASETDPRLEMARRIAATHQSSLTVKSGRDGRRSIQIAFPPERCLSAF